MSSFKRRFKLEAENMLPDENFKRGVKRRVFCDSSSSAGASKEKKRVTPAMKGFLAAAVSFCLVIAICLGAYFGLIYKVSPDPNGDTGETYISIDINPSFEIIANAKDVVTAVNALNKDAVIVLYGKTSSYIGKSVDIVCAEIIKESVKLGYVSELNNEIDILAVNKNGEKEKKVLDSIKTKVDGALGDTGARVVVKNDNAENGMRALIEDACRILGISEEEAATMTVGELNKRMKAYDEETLDKLEEELEREYESNKDKWGGLDEDALEDAIDEWKESAKREEEELEDLLEDYINWYEKIYLPSTGVIDEDTAEDLADDEEDRLERLSREMLKEFLNAWLAENSGEVNEQKKLDALSDDYLDWYEDVYLPSVGVTGELESERMMDQEEDRLKSLEREDLKRFLEEWAAEYPDYVDSES